MNQLNAMHVHTAACLLFTLCPPGAATAQADHVGPERRYILFLDRSYFFNAVPYRDLIFEAQIAPPIFLLQNTGKVAAAVYDTTSFRWLGSHSVSFTPMTRLRMLNEPSAPVRTPSYMPKLDFQYFWIRRAERGTGMRQSAVERLPLDLWSAHVTVGHHSNGQEGCLFAHEDPRGEDCVPARPATSPPTFNYRDGSFSTNYIRTAARYARVALDDNLRLRRLWSVALSYEMNPEKLGPGGINERLRSMYGPNRWRAAGEGTWKTSRPNGLLRLDGFVETTPDVLAGVPAATVSARGEWTFDKVGGWGAMLRFYRGQDYYNLGFSRKLQELQFGIVFDAGRWLEFEIPPR